MHLVHTSILKHYNYTRLWHISHVKHYAMKSFSTSMNSATEPTDMYSLFVIIANQQVVTNKRTIIIHRPHMVGHKALTAVVCQSVSPMVHC